MIASSEVHPDEYSRLSTLSDETTMKPLFRYVFLALASIGQTLQSLQRSFQERTTRRAPALVPIRIHSERHPRGPVGRHPYRGR